MDPRPLVAAIDICTSANELDNADAFIETLASIDPSYQGLINSRAKVAMLRGNSVQAITLFEQAVKIRPSWQNLRDLANAELRGGRPESANRHLNEALEYAPSNSYLKAQLGQLELMAGNFRAATGLFDELTQHHPRAQYFANLGLAHMMLREFSEAIEAFSSADRLSPGNPVSLLNLADCHTLTGDIETGTALYKEALKMTDDRVESLDNLSVRAQCLAHLGNAPEAVKAVLREVALAPDDAQSRYDAALVHAIIDDRHAAAVYASQAIELGMAEIWLQLPWFDNINWQEILSESEDQLEHE